MGVVAERIKVQGLERLNAYDPFCLDAYGVKSPLIDKRKARGWDERNLVHICRGVPERVRDFVYAVCVPGFSGAMETDDLPW